MSHDIAIWKQIKEVLDRVIGLPAEERTAILSNCDTHIRDEVLSLLAFEPDLQGVLDDAAISFVTDDILGGTPASDAGMPKRIGPFEIGAELGIGGMGAVYVARRTDGKFDQRVAIKMLKREFNVESLRRNFTREGRVLSRLDHPNVAHLIDTGTTDDGIPYIVMEYIPGLPIDEYCIQNDLTLDRRLKLFQKVCDAVEFTHRNLIIHRDLKPSNILISDNGEPKLLDFGISKLISPDTAATRQNTTLHGAMTPQYASPEQRSGKPVDTRSDVYSLGVVLHKMLTGKLPSYPTKAGNVSDALAPDLDLCLPSDQIKGLKGSINAAQLYGDIDNIILKALNISPDDRYASIEQFSADIWRHIDGRPVTARAATFIYRAAKFFRRNRVWTTAAALMALSLIIGIALAAWQANEARTQARNALEAQNRAIIETEKAKTEQNKSEKISKFMGKIISYANPAWYAEGSKFQGNARVIDAMLDLSSKIDVEFNGQPDVQAELHHKFSETFIFAVNPTKDPAMVELFQNKRKFHAMRALGLRIQYYGSWHELVAKDLFYAYNLISDDPKEQAEMLYLGIRMMRSTNPDNINLPYMYEAFCAQLTLPEYEKYQLAYRDIIASESGGPATDQARLEVAEKYYREALKLFRQYYGKDNTAIWANECRLAYTLATETDPKDAVLHFNICRSGDEKTGNEMANAKLKIDIERTSDEFARYGIK